MNKIDKSKRNISNAPKNKSSLSYHDFITLLFVVAILLIDFLPYFKTYEIIAPQYLYLTLLNIVIGIYIFYTPNLHSSNLLLIFRKNYLFKTYLLFIALCGISIFTAKNKSLGIVSIAEIIVTLSTIINFVILFYNRMHLVYKVAFIIGISAFLQSFVAIYNFQIIALSKSISEALVSNFMKGNTGNINVLAASLLYKISFIYIAITHFNNLKRLFLSIALIFSTTCIFLINARASLLSLIIITVVFLIYHYKNSILKKYALKNLLYIIIPLVISVFSVNLIFSSIKSDPNLSAKDNRFSSTSDRLKQLNASDNSIQRRLTFYKAALVLTKQSPIIGIGLGNYRVESIPLDYTTNSSVPLHTHNDFLELTAETGVINGMLYLSIFIFLLVINVKKLISTNDKQVKNISLLVLLLLVIYGIDSLFNFPFYRPTMQICFCFLMVFTLLNNFVEKENSVTGKWFFTSLIVLAILPLYFTYNAYRTSHLEYLIQTDNINFESSGVLTGDDVINSTPKIPNVFQSAESFVEYAGIYYFREKKYDEAIKLLDSANKINPYTGRPDFYKFLIANEIGQTDSAYVFIKRAFYNRPINDLFYDKAINQAMSRADTLEILKMYNAYSLSANKPQSWAKAYVALNNSGYSENGKNSFRNIALKEFPRDTFVNEAINSAQITNLIIKGQALFAAGKHEKALETYREGLKIDSKNIYVLQNIGFYYYNLNQPKEAISYFKSALDKPGLNDGKTQFYIGMSYINIGDKDNACKYFKLAGQYPDAQSQIMLHCYY